MKNEKFYEARKAKGLSQYALASAIGQKTNTQITAYERYGILPTWNIANKIAEILEVPVKELWPTIGED